MTAENLRDLKDLCDASGVSGFEEPVTEVILRMAEPYADKLYVDRTGNVIAFRRGYEKTTESPVFYGAHMDEVGLVVKHVNEDGTLLFDAIGILPEALLSKRVLVGKQAIPGVIGAKPVHLTRGKTYTPTLEDLYIDIGTKSREESVSCGVYAQCAVFAPDFERFGEGLVRSKALDDRMGCFVMLEMLKNGVRHDSYFAFTRGEELGGVGVTAAVRTVNPAVSVIFEATTASDLPDTEERNAVCRVGGGAVMPFMDGRTRYDKELWDAIRQRAAEKGIPTQTKSRIAGGTDASSIQRALAGVRVAAVSLACRYIHTSSCVAAETDMDACLALGRMIGEML